MRCAAALMFGVLLTSAPLLSEERKGVNAGESGAQRRLKDTFSALDRDQDGLVSGEEYALSGLPGTGASFRRADRNQDGLLSREEHQQLAMGGLQTRSGGAGVPSQGGGVGTTGRGSQVGGAGTTGVGPISPPFGGGGGTGAGG